jgi:hypothetical protein
MIFRRNLRNLNIDPSFFIGTAFPVRIKQTIYFRAILTKITGLKELSKLLPMYKCLLPEMMKKGNV